MTLEIRPFGTKEEFGLLVRYFIEASDPFLLGMGVDRKLLPTYENGLKEIWDDHQRPEPERDRIYLAWIYDGQLVGHSSINKIIWGKEASIHLHLWRSDLRKKGLGTTFFCLSANHFLRTFGFQKLYCEPYAENPAPNKVLSKIGFKFVMRYKTVPGKTNFEQDVNRWELDHELDPFQPKSGSIVEN